MTDPQYTSETEAAQEAAERYLRAGLMVIPVPAGEKNPNRRGWQNERHGVEDIPKLWTNGQGIGILWGAPSGNRVDVDLDWPEARVAATYILPPTRVFGRPSAPESHRVYRVAGELPESKKYKLGGTGPERCVVEVLSTGAQSLVPPSLHDSGERREWNRDQPTTEIDGAVLMKAAADVATAALLARNWPGQGARHDYALAAAGYVGRHLSRERAERVMEGAITASGDDEAPSRRRAVETTLEALKANRPATGGPTLDDLAPGIVDRLQRWHKWSKAEASSPPRPAAEDGRPEIVLSSEDAADVMDAATSAMEGANDPPSLFVRAGTLSRVGRDEEGVARIQTVNVDGLRERMARSARFVNVNTKGSRVPTAPPKHIAQMVHASGSWPWLPPLTGISGVPVLGPDGTVHDRPGYDPGSRIFYDVGPGGEVPPPVPSHPTDAEAEAALEDVEKLIADFPFAEEADRANALGMLLTPIARPWISGPVPLALIDKPKMGSGASLLAAAVGIIATGRAPFLGAPAKEEEWTKAITSAMISGQTVLIFDNIAERLTSAALSRALTATTWQDRLLGANVLVELPQRATWIATGNNIAVGGDLPRRCYRIRIDPKVSKPWQRGDFEIPDLLAHCQQNRPRIVADLLTLCLYWYRAGQPLTQEERPRIGGFEGWDRTVSGILEYAGVEKFLGNVEEFYDAADEEGVEWEAFLAAWYGAFGEQALTVGELVSRFDMQEGRQIKEALPTELAEIYENRHSGFTRSLGRALTRKSGAMFGHDRYHAAPAGEHRRSTKWRVRCL